MLFHNINIDLRSIDGSESHHLIIPSVPLELIQKIFQAVLELPIEETTLDEENTLEQILNLNLGLDNIKWEPPNFSTQKKKVDIADLGDIPLTMFDEVMDKLDKNDFIVELEENECVPTTKEVDASTETKSSQSRHVCDICQKTFKKKHQLKNHGLVHSGIKKFECQFCRKLFKQLGHLKIHTEEIHKIEDSSLVCDICDKSFKSARKLKYHQKYTHSQSKKKVPCPTCGSEFSRGKLKQHILRDHEKVLPYSCQYLNCDKKFVSPYYLQRHVKRSHK